MGLAFYFYLCNDSAMNPKTSLYFVTPPALIGRNHRIRELADEGKSYAEIGRLYGLTGARIGQIVKRERENTVRQILRPV